MPNAASAGRSASGQRWIHPERNTLAMPICFFCFQAWRTQKTIRRLCMRSKVRRIQTPKRRSFRHGKCRSWRKTAELISSPDLGNACWDSCRIRGRQHAGEGCGIRASEKEYGQFYNRPYGASLCPAWASGPVFLLPRILPGLRPLKDGWKTFACQPSPDIRDIRCAVPAPHGLSEAEWVDGKLSFTIQGRAFESMFYIVKSKKRGFYETEKDPFHPY